MFRNVNKKKCRQSDSIHQTSLSRVMAYSNLLSLLGIHQMLLRLCKPVTHTYMHDALLQTLDSMQGPSSSSKPFFTAPRQNILQLLCVIKFPFNVASCNYWCRDPAFHLKKVQLFCVFRVWQKIDDITIFTLRKCVVYKPPRVYVTSTFVGSHGPD